MGSKQEGGAYPVDNLVHDDKIIATVTYTVDGYVVSEKIYTWTVKIPTPELIDADFTNAPGTQDPAFDKKELNYILDLPVGTQSTTATIDAEVPEKLDLVIKHESPSRNIEGDSAITVCENCDFQSVSWPFHVHLPTQVSTCHEHEVAS